MYDVFMLSRLQFAANVSFHILFPSITIALAWIIVFFRWRWGKTQDEAWLRAYYLWTKIFALTFSLGVVTGVTMSFQFGTNWPGFMERAGNIAGPLLGYEVLTAFFLEAGFLGIMLFGYSRVSQRVHLTASVIVAVGTLLSAFWILALNSWMQTPQGFSVDEQGVLHATDWLAIIFNPSFPYRLVHMMLASILTASFLLVGISAWQVLRKSTDAATSKVMRLGMTLAAVSIVLQIFVGDQHGLNTLKHQPAKVAAMEGLWQTESSVPLLLFAWPDEETKSNKFEVGIPHGASLILTHSRDGEIKGLNEFEHHPPVAPVFWAFRIMVGMGILMLFLSWYGFYRLRKMQWQAEKLPRYLLYVFSATTFIGWVATLAGWYVTEIGRQPFLVYGHLLTQDAVTQAVPSAHIGLTLIAYLVIYALLMVAYLTVLKLLAEKNRSAQETMLDQYAKNREKKHINQAQTERKSTEQRLNRKVVDEHKMRGE